MDTQHSTDLFDTLTFISIKGDTLKLALFETAKQSIIHLGNQEHTGDWDPYLIINLEDGTQIEADAGYEDIIFNDFNDEEQSTFLKHHEEITSISVYIENEDDYENPKLISIPINEIKTISLQR